MDALLLMFLIPGIYDSVPHECDGNVTILEGQYFNKGKAITGNWLTTCEHNELKLQCPHNFQIRIHDAKYGRDDKTTCGTHSSQIHCSAGNTKKVLQKKCDGKRKCSIQASNENFGDPCHGVMKYLKVRYSCEKVTWQEVNSEIVCEHEKLSINCPKGKVILVESAFYGRNSKEVCPNTLNSNTRCSAEKAFRIVKKMCNFNHHCTIRASNEVFQDPCPYTAKYLRVDYKCAYENEVRDGKIKKVKVLENEIMYISCPKGSHISVICANYRGIDNINQTPCISSNALNIVSDRCKNKETCTLVSGNSVFGDTAPNIKKYLEVEYQCEHDDYRGDTSLQTFSNVKHNIVCENNEEEINCPSGLVIKIIDGFYGRTDKTTCPHTQTSDFHCHADKSKQKIEERCNLNERCTLSSTNAVFGDPCVGTYKYMNVTYKCVTGNNTVKENSQSFDNIKENIVCENDFETISCPHGSIISIKDAFYGRKDASACLHPQIHDLHCKAEKSKEAVEEMCHFKDQCKLSSVNAVFGDPCVGTYKYLNVTYECISVLRLRKVILKENEHRPISCPNGHSIKIDDAIYGLTESVVSQSTHNNCSAQYAHDILSARCDRLSSCELIAKNNVFGDPCIGKIKTLEVEYHCEEEYTNYGKACEHNNLEMDCPSDTRIHILKAHYGRLQPFICNSRTTPIPCKGCASKNAFSLVSNICEGHSYCVVPAENYVFGDPCNSVEKYLEVEYICKDISIPEDSKRNVTFYLDTFPEGVSANYTVQWKVAESESTKWKTMVEGNMSNDHGKPLALSGLDPGQNYDLRVVRNEDLDSEKCIPFVRVTTAPWIDPR